MARKTKEEAQKTREGILDAAIEVFMRQGVTRSGLADIAKEAGVTRGAIYHHFANKGALLSSLMQRIDDFFKPLEAYNDIDNLDDPLGALVEKKIKFFRMLSHNEKMAKLFHVILAKTEAVADGGVIFLHRVKYHNDAIAQLQELLKKANERGQLAENIDIRLTAIAFFTSMDGLIQNWILYPDLFDVEEDIPILINGMVRMLTTMPLKEA